MVKLPSSMRKIIYMLLWAVSITLAACNGNGDDPELPPPTPGTGSEADYLLPPKKQAGTKRIISYNVGIFNKFIQDDYEFIADMMKEVEADVVCLNELDSCTNRTRKVFQAKRIAEAMGGWSYCFGPAITYDGGKYGEGLMSKEKPVEQYYIPLPQNNGAEARVLAVMEFEDYVVASTHLDHVSAQARVEQAKVISSEMIKRYGDTDKRVFLGGDMNATPDSDVIKTLKKDWTILSGTSGRENFTFSTKEPKSCIDFIMLLNNGATVKVVHRQVITAIKAGDVKLASDHFPVLLEVDW